MDKLDEIFKHQEALQRRLGISPRKYDQKYINEMTLAAIAELTEFIDSTPWKPWKIQQKYDEKNAKMELADTLHFLVNLCMAIGMESDDLFNEYMAKNMENFARKERGY